MTIRTFDFCALQYLNQWLEKESLFCHHLATGVLEDQRGALISAGAHFSIARNLPIKFEIENMRYQPVLNLLNTLGEVTPSNVENIVEASRQSISTQYGGRDALSLVTKFLWLKVKYPVRIYDRQARIALGTGDRDYSSFNAKFSEQFAKHEEEIEQACNNLKKVVSYSVNPKMNEVEIDSLVSQIWFKERVFDIYLWNIAKS